MGREKDIERYLTRRCKELGVLCWKLSSPGRRGVPDRIAIYKGRVFFIEVKSYGKEPTILQNHYIEQLREHGINACWVNSRHSIDTVLTVLTDPDSRG